MAILTKSQMILEKADKYCRSHFDCVGRQTKDGATKALETDARAENVDLTSDEARTIVALVREASVENKFGPAAGIVSTDVKVGVIRMLEALLNDVAAVSPCRSKPDMHMARLTTRTA